MNILSHHPSAAHDLIIHEMLGSNSIGYALESSASMLIYVKMALIQESSLRLQSRPADSKSHHHRVSPLMQMQQLVSSFSTSSPRSNYFFWLFGFTRKKNQTYIPCTGLRGKGYSFLKMQAFLFYLGPK